MNPAGPSVEDDSDGVSEDRRGGHPGGDCATAVAGTDLGPSIVARIARARGWRAT